MNVPSETTSAAASPLESSQDALRERILEAALRAFAERGFHGTTVPDVAKAARVGVGSIYRHFESKERLVNAVFRETKGRLRDALLLDLELGREPEALFAELWARLSRFQRQEREAFQFLEMQDHVPYLDGESRAVEASLLAPLLMATRAAAHEDAGVPAEVLMAMVWGAFVGLVKAERLAYLTLDEDAMERAGKACFRFVSSSLSSERSGRGAIARAASGKKKPPLAAVASARGTKKSKPRTPRQGA